MSKEIVFSYHGERCHAEIVQELTLSNDLELIGETNGFIIYHKLAPFFSPFNFVACKKNTIRQPENIKYYCECRLDGVTYCAIIESVGIYEATEAFKRKIKIFAKEKNLSYVSAMELADKIEENKNFGLRFDYLENLRDGKKQNVILVLGQD